MGDDGIAVTNGRATINGVDFAYLEAGAGRLALCMHGFPDTAWGWQGLLPELADAGFHAVAPFARGYAPTAVPADGSSPIGAWVADARGFHDHFGGDEPGVLVGHDWGALAAYGSAVRDAERWSRLVTASVPPAATMASRMMSYDQLKAFWYQHFFMQPLADAVVGMDDLAFIEGLWADWSPDYDATHALSRVKEALREPANIAAALSTYRTMYDTSLQSAEVADDQAAVFGSHTQPTLYLHGETDGCIPALSPDELDGALPEGSMVEIIEGAGHFLHYEQPLVVNRLVVEFLTSGQRSGPRDP